MRTEPKAGDARDSLPPQRIWESMDDLRSQHALLRSKVTELHSDIINTFTSLEALRDSTLRLFEAREAITLERIRMIEGAIIEIGRNTGLFSPEMEQELRHESEHGMARDREEVEAGVDALMREAGDVIGGAVIPHAQEDGDAQATQG